MGFLWYIIIGIAAGFLAGKIMRGGGFGVIINLILGISRRCIGRLGIRITRNCSFRYYRQSDYGDSRSHSDVMDRFVV